MKIKQTKNVTKDKIYRKKCTETKEQSQLYEMDYIGVFGLPLISG